MVKAKRRARGEGTIFQRADGKWVTRVKLPDGSSKPIVRRKQADLMKARDELIDDIKSGRYATAKNTDTVESWLNHWLDDIHVNNVDPGTIDDYRRNARLHLIPAIGSIKLSKLTPDDVRTMHKVVGEKSSRQAQISHHILNGAIKTACIEGKLNINVADMVPTPGHVKKKRAAWSLDLAHRIMDTAVAMDERDGTRFASRVYAAFYTGTRPGECIGLELDRLNLKDEVADFGWQLQQHTRTHGCGSQRADKSWPCGRIKAGYCPEAHWELPKGFEHRECYKSLLWTRPKSDDGQRMMPIVEPLLTMLREHVKADPWPNPHGLVWHHRDGRPISPREDNTLWHAVFKEACVTTGDPYTARHTMGTGFLQLHINPKITRDIMGHADEQTTEIYQHVDLDLRREALKKWSDRLAASAPESD
ncbi:putative phage integrase [Mycobacteroides chelonae]|uniref:tyrosine-type recombinase/integrase n=1 Tax=Mycobacteroides chelonae TaxID=1774 RepID=UPI0021DBA7C7|nr:site-specific integrase [Mycobacteroides chelonae]GLE59590.1 putative phage integrase [Mycobacteroides chelonae]